MQKRVQKIIIQVIVWSRRHWRRLAVFGGGGLLLLFVVVQAFYPANMLLPFTKIDGVNLGGWNRADAAKLLDQKYSEQKLNVYFGNATKPYSTAKLSDIGIESSNEARLNKVGYPWWLRVVPTSILWGQSVVGDGQPSVSRDASKSDAYINSLVGESCTIAPKNATLKLNGEKLEVIAGEAGGKCELGKFTEAVNAFKPVITKENAVRVAMQEIASDVNAADVKALAEKLQARVGTGVAIKAGTQTVIIPAGQVLGWLDFAVVDGEPAPQINGDRAAEYLAGTIAPKVTIRAGVTKITTQDFTETSRQDGSNGQALNQAATLAAILAYLNGSDDEVVAKVSVVLPTMQYTRTYSATDEGLMALVKNYAQDNPGTFGISLVELSGKRRRASYNDTRQFVTASTYKLYVAYSTLRRVEAGTFSWSDQISGGRDLSKCFDDMIVKSDNACAEALLTKIGFRAATDEAKALGLDNTTFMKGDSPLTTSGDLAIFLATLESGQMLSPESRSRLLDAMKRNIYRQGVPAGVTSVVADKVGFMDGLLHDAAIVYSPSGTYVLTVMTEGSSWQAIAKLAEQIEKLRSS